MEKNTVTIFSYTKVWKVEKKMYTIMNLALPRPVSIFDLVAFIGVALGMLVLGKIIPGIEAIPEVIRFIAIPYGIVNYLMKKKLDGKNPLIYFFDCIVYFITVRGSFLQQYKKYADKREKFTLKWNCSMGIQE